MSPSENMNAIAYINRFASAFLICSPWCVIVCFSAEFCYTLDAIQPSNHATWHGQPATFQGHDR